MESNYAMGQTDKRDNGNYRRNLRGTSPSNIFFIKVENKLNLSPLF